jgi:hypothetical protein
MCHTWFDLASGAGERYRQHIRRDWRTADRKVVVFRFCACDPTHDCTYGDSNRQAADRNQNGDHTDKS